MGRDNMERLYSHNNITDVWKELSSAFQEVDLRTCYASAGYALLQDEYWLSNLKVMSFDNFPDGIVIRRNKRENDDIVCEKEREKPIKIQDENSELVEYLESLRAGK